MRVIMYTCFNKSLQEALSDTVNLPEEDPAMVKLMVQYLYEGDYLPTMLPWLPPKADTSSNSASRPVAPVSGSFGSSTPSLFASSRNTVSQPSMFGNAQGQSTNPVPLPATTPFSLFVPAPKKQPPNVPHSCVNGGCTSTIVCSHHVCGQQCRFTCNNFVCPQCNPPVLLLSLDKQVKHLSTHATMYGLGDQYARSILASDWISEMHIPRLQISEVTPTRFGSMLI